MFAGLLYGNQICGFNPNDLAAGATICRGVVPNPDGIASDGAGNLYIAATGDASVYQYNFASDTAVQERGKSSNAC